MKYTKSVTLLLILFLVSCHLVACSTMTPLAKATKDGDINKLSDLISSGGNINERERKAGWSLLHYAIYYNQIDAVKFLIEKGANVNITDAQGYTPLLFALHYINKDIINVLVDSGANMNILNKEGYTPLSYALHYRYFKVSIPADVK